MTKLGMDGRPLCAGCGARLDGGSPSEGCEKCQPREAGFYWVRLKPEDRIHSNPDTPWEIAFWLPRGGHMLRGEWIVCGDKPGYEPLEVGERVRRDEPVCECCTGCSCVPGNGQIGKDGKIYCDCCHAVGRMP